MVLGRCVAKALENWFWCRTDVINPLHPFSPFPYNFSHLINIFLLFFFYSLSSFLEFLQHVVQGICISCVHAINFFFTKIIHTLTNELVCWFFCLLTQGHFSLLMFTKCFLRSNLEFAGRGIKMPLTYFFFSEISTHFVPFYWLWSSSTSRKSISELHLTPVTQVWDHEACWTMQYWHAVLSWSPPRVLALFPHCTMLLWCGKRMSVTWKTYVPILQEKVLLCVYHWREINLRIMFPRFYFVTLRMKLRGTRLVQEQHCTIMIF